MTRQVPSDLNIVRRFYDRWEPFEDTRRQISDDLKELFAEAKAEGLNPKALRSAFAEQYRVEHQTSDEAKKRLNDGADFELYLSALARVREDDDETPPASQDNGGGPAETVDLTVSADTIHRSPVSDRLTTVNDRESSLAGAEGDTDRRQFLSIAPGGEAIAHHGVVGP
ncbi:MAG: GapR family DNA-binding domain-containing protein [Nitrobacter sp.]